MSGARAPGHAEAAVTDLEPAAGSGFRALGVYGDDPVLDPRSEPAAAFLTGHPVLPRVYLGLADGHAQNLGQAGDLYGSLAEVRQPDHRKAEGDGLGGIGPVQFGEEAGKASVVAVLNGAHVISPFG
jgi:hypothetical protein